jgi:predicted dehydrogenase
MFEREDLGAVWVCTPPLLHREPAVWALECGIHVYLEKPIARTVADGDAIARAAARSEAVCAIGYQWHASELLHEIRTATEAQMIGMLIGRNYGPVEGRSWFVDSQQGGGQILERGSHHIDLQRAIAGEIEAVEAVAGSATLSPRAEERGNIEDVLTLTFHFRSGALGNVSIAWSRDDQPELYALDVIAADASIWVNLGPQDFTLGGLAAGVELDAAHADPFDRSIRGFLEAVRSERRDRVFCTPDDAVRTLKVAVACERALVERKAVPVPD